MSLSTEINSHLWASVQNAYEAGNYTGAILDSIHFLSDLIRDKSGLDSDGNALVGSAFGGQNPVVKVSALHTETDRDEQRGVEYLLRGIYTAIRNPRSHEKRTDTCESADAIIGFINHLVSLIDKSRSPFDKEQIIQRVFDRHFVHVKSYADLLVGKVPPLKRLELLLEVFQRRTASAHWKNVGFFTYAALRVLDAEEAATFWAVVSEALEQAATDAEFRSAIQIAGQDWLKVSEIARLRAENRLIECVREGEFDRDSGQCAKGGLGTWATTFAADFLLKDELVDAIVDRLTSDQSEAVAYGTNFFLPTLQKLRQEPPLEVVSALRELLGKHDALTHESLSFLPFEEPDSKWSLALLDAYEKYEPEAPAIVSTEITDEDIPF